MNYKIHILIYKLILRTTTKTKNVRLLEAKQKSNPLQNTKINRMKPIRCIKPTQKFFLVAPFLKKTEWLDTSHPLHGINENELPTKRQNTK